jgi:hypothetical protein
VQGKVCDKFDTFTKASNPQPTSPQPTSKTKKEQKQRKNKEPQKINP